MTVYFHIATQSLRISASNLDEPVLQATLRTGLEFDVAFILAGVVAPLTGDAPVAKALIKATPTSDVLLLDADLESNDESGTARRYSAAWAPEDCDSSALRAALGSKTEINVVVEIEATYEVESETKVVRATCPMVFKNSYSQPSDVPPNPVANASWELFKSTVLAGTNTTRTLNEEAKTMTFSSEDADANAAAISAEAATRLAEDNELHDQLDALSDAVDGKADASHTHDASQITSGVLDPARIPLLYSGIQVVSSGGIADLTSPQQTSISAGAVVTTTDGRRWTYSGSGSKTSEASYIQLADITPDWSAISNKPTEFPPETHNHDSRYYTETEVDDALAGKQAALTAASQAEMEAGTEATLRSMSPLRVAQAIAALGGGGGASITHTGVAFVDQAAGNNGTAVVGNPAKPFATIQAAFDASASIFHIIGSVGDLALGTNFSGTLLFIGVGRNVSAIGAITRSGEGPGLLRLLGNGREMISVQSIANTGTNGADGVNGATPGEAGTDGGGGETAGDLEVDGLYVAFSITTTGGLGGAGGHGADGDGEALQGGNGGNGGSGGNAAVVLVENCYVGGSVINNGGYGGNGGDGGDDAVLTGGNGGDGGNGGSSAALTIRNSRIAAGTNNNGGNEGAGGEYGTGTINGSAGLAGTAGDDGETTMIFYEGGVPSDYGTLVVRAAIIDGSFYADTYP